MDSIHDDRQIQTQTTSHALPFLIRLCNITIVKIPPQGHFKRGLRAGAKLLVDHGSKEGEQDGGPLTSKVQAITEVKSIIFVPFYEGVALFKLSLIYILKASPKYPQSYTQQLFNGIYQPERCPQIDARSHQSCVQVDKSCSQPFCCCKFKKFAQNQMPTFVQPAQPL